MTERENHTLIAWHSHRAGGEVLKNALQALAQDHKVHIRQVFYLLQPQHKNLAQPKIPAGIDFKTLILPIEDPTKHLLIYQMVRDKLLPKIGNCPYLHINISPGTPAMHTVWLILYAGGAFPAETKLWSSQYNQKEETTRIDLVDFPINTYLAEIRSQSRLQPTVALYDGEPRSTARREALHRLSRYARLPNAPLLILGERGIGKTRLVETHVVKLKQRKTLITVPCGTLDSELAESMLFGHTKGAFTGANQARPGLLKEADNGILFLDEIQDLAKPLQRKLVRVFQGSEHYFRPVGSDKEISVDIEVVCASNRNITDLQEMLDADLFDRLSHLIVEIPPLRQCREDLQNDWQRVWSELPIDENQPKTPPSSSELEKMLKTHELPGNLRDLQHLAWLCMAWQQEKPLLEALKQALEEWHQRKISTSVKHAEFGEGTYAERVEWFKKRMVLWAKNINGGQWKDTAKYLQCTEKTLRNCINRES
ncbi:sigma 54-interacting transcriptional regulator [Candidatus Venteria ishoeyi]|uniref:sigma-54-dependent transcriptional regulator n=1 Tax=Candidatus Venteria ishoeyi TaxID=1899563 RepID=UPI0025A50F57|nr:sigma 54-interacting transcriptional regulator [Candidatus Venteria ishoeyi]MDM8548340.1 sigma 54-interacting transcriptional regulator [Candidatus Venteria ishoeyi]